MSGTTPQSAALQPPQPSYFSLRRSRSYLSGSPSESPATTPGTPADVETQLLTPGGRPNLLKSKLPVPSRFLKTTKKGAAGPTRLQARWLGKASNPLSPDLASDVQSALPFTSSSPEGSSALSSIRSSLYGSQSSGLSSLSSNGHHHHRGRKTSEDSHDADGRQKTRSSSHSGSDEIQEVARSIHDGEHVRPSIIIRDYGTSDEGRSPVKFDPLHRLDSSGHSNGSGKWADRLRQRPSQLSLSFSRDPTSPSPDLLSPATVYLRPSLAVRSTSNIEDSLSRNFLRTNSRPRTGKNLDDGIDFDRIKLPSPLAPSPSLPELRSPFENPSESIDPRDMVDRFRPKPPPRGIPRVSRETSTGSSFSISSGETEDDIDEDDDDELGPPPDVPPALEYVDPEIECIAPNASTTTLPFAEAQIIDQPGNQHPWSTPPFNIVERGTPTIHKWRSTFKISISLLVVSSLLVGYGLRVKIVRVGPWSFGMYGLLLVVDFIVQTIAASINRRRVNALTKKSPIVKGVAERLAAQDEIPAVEPTALPEVSIAVVGYREDEEAWIACLKSLQAQEYPIKHIIGVVDGNDGPDLAMAEAFGKAFPEDQRLISHLPVLLSVMYKEKYWEHLNSLDHPRLSRWQFFKMWLTQKARPGQAKAHEVALNHILNYLHAKATEERWADWKGICFSQPHGHKRHAMFTAFMVGAYALGTKDAMLTTDSDTYVYPDAVKNMMALLFSDSRLAGVTGDVRIWNKSDSFLALMSSIRYWFAFNVERACQSAFGCVGCLSGPLGLYKTSDLMSVLGPWILQTFLGKETTFGDDRHLSNRILSLGHKTGYTHLAMCDSDTPAGYVRWVKQQTRWSKSFFREAYWFPKSFAYHDFWLTVETTKQFMYPMVLTATVIHMLYQPTSWIRPLIWLATMFGVAVIKSIYGVICLKDPRQFLFGIYGFMYFFGLLPSKLFACFTVHITNWGTSARSKSEFARPESLLSRTTHVGHLVVWYMMLSVGLGYLLATVFHQPYFWLIGILGALASSQVYSDVIVGEVKYAIYMMKKKRKARHAAKAQDLEKGTTKTKRSAFKKLRRGKRSQKIAVEADLPLEEIPEVIPPALATADTSVDASVDDRDARAAVPMASGMPGVESPFAPSRQVSSSSSSSMAHPPALTAGPTSRTHTNSTGGRKGSISSGSTRSDENMPYTPDVALATEPVLNYLPLGDTLLKALTKARVTEAQEASGSTSGDSLRREKDDMVIEEIPRSPGALVS